MRVGPHGGGGTASKVWHDREWRDLEPKERLGGRSWRLALRRLRLMAREGRRTELDLRGTVAATAKSGLLDVRWRPERANRLRVLLFCDVGGSMDAWVERCEQLFFAARSELRELRVFFFHNCIYDHVWTESARRRATSIPLRDILRTHDDRARVFVVGDASMSPWELIEPGGAIDHWNEEKGETWLRRLAGHYTRLAWLNPVPRVRWDVTASIDIVRTAIGGRMFELTLEGLEEAIAFLRTGARRPGSGPTRR